MSIKWLEKFQHYNNNPLLRYSSNHIPILIYFNGNQGYKSSVIKRNMDTDDDNKTIVIQTWNNYRMDQFYKFNYTLNNLFV